MLRPVEERPVGQVRHTADHIAGCLAVVGDTVDLLAVVEDTVDFLAVVEDIVGRLAVVEDTDQLVPKDKTVSASKSQHSSRCAYPNKSTRRFPEL